MRHERFKTSPSWPKGPSPRLAHQPRPRHGSLGRKNPSVAATFASCCELPSSPGNFGRVFPVGANCDQPSVAAAELLSLYQQSVFQVSVGAGHGGLDRDLDVLAGRPEAHASDYRRPSWGIKCGYARVRPRPGRTSRRANHATSNRREPGGTHVRSEQRHRRG